MFVLGAPLNMVRSWDKPDDGQTVSKSGLRERSVCRILVVAVYRIMVKQRKKTWTDVEYHNVTASRGVFITVVPGVRVP